MRGPDPSLDDEETLPGPPVETQFDAAGHTIDAGGVPSRDIASLDAPLLDDSLARLNHYILLDKLGEGGMGVVFAAYDERLDRKVALKLLRAEGGDLSLTRLVREAQALARLSHPNVVQIYEIAEHDGLHFLVMEFIEGETLGAWRARTEPDHAALLEVFMAAGRGLAAAHAKGLVHRDFKPDNVMIQADGRVVVMDFGLAREGVEGAEGEPHHEDGEHLAKLSLHGVTASSELSTELTRTGALMGTPAYMSPEQYLGIPTDAHSDQFSFCVALWEALHGQRPFAADNLAALSLAVLNNRRATPTATVPSWLQQVVDRGMMTDPRARWPSMDALLEALAADPTARRRAWIFAGVAAALLACAGLGARLWTSQHEAEIRERCATEASALHQLWSHERRDGFAQRVADTKLGNAWQRAQGWMDRYAEDWASTREASCLATHLEGTREPAIHDQVEACLDEERVAVEAMLEGWDSAEDRVVAHSAPTVAGLEPPSACEDARWLAQRIELPAEASARAEITRIRAELIRANSSHALGELEAALERAKQALADAEQLAWEPLVAEALLALGALEGKHSQLEEARAHIEQASLRATAAAHDLVALRAAVELSGIVGQELSEHARGYEWAARAEALLTRTGLMGTIDEAAYRSDLASLH